MGPPRSLRWLCTFLERIKKNETRLLYVTNSDGIWNPSDYTGGGGEEGPCFARNFVSEALSFYEKSIVKCFQINKKNTKNTFFKSKVETGESNESIRNLFLINYKTRSGKG